jgi:hypothetical protein
MSQIYVYAVIPAAEPRKFDVAGLWPVEPQVRTICGEGLAAVVGTSPPVDFRALPREDAVHYLIAHQRVVEAVMGTSPALPVKFGTTLPDEAAVVSLLVRGAAVLAPRLAEVSQHVQVELIVTWTLEEVLREVAAEEAVVRLKGEVEAQPAEATNDLRVALGRLVKGAIDRRRESCRSRILSALRPIAADLAENALMDDRMVANLALLLPEQASEALDQRLAQLDGEFEQRLNFRCIGPLPPYSFASVEVNLPSFEVIDQARRALSLGDRAGLAEIKSAYRRLIRQSHPDLPAAAPINEGQAALLTDSYKTLMSYAKAWLSAGSEGAPAEGGYRFDREAVEGAILVAVQRLELSASRPEGQP